MTTGTTMNRVKLVALILLAFPPLSLLALSSDRDQPIHIEADNLQIDDTRNISIYQGNVAMQQGSLNIKAERIIFHFDDTKNLQWIEITGAPATFNQLNAKQEPISGSALKMDYYEDKSLMELTGDAQFQSNQDTIESEFISINTETEAMQAGDRQGKSRVRMLIQPRP